MTFTVSYDDKAEIKAFGGEVTHLSSRHQSPGVHHSKTIPVAVMITGAIRVIIIKLNLMLYGCDCNHVLNISPCQTRPEIKWMDSNR